MGELWKKLWSIYPRENLAETAAEKLKVSMRTTVKCRFEAADRLKNLSRFSFFTTTVLSLGLILIPLIQNSEVELAFPTSVLNMMQIFLAVAVLVFSVVIGTANYDLRAELLTECGNRMKELIREMNRLQENSGGVSPAELSDLELRYSKIATDVENHSRVDFRYSRLDMRNDFFLYGIPRLRYWAGTLCLSFFPYLVPLLLIGFELVFILDMLYITNWMPAIFHKANVL